MSLLLLFSGSTPAQTLQASVINDEALWADVWQDIWGEIWAGDAFGRPTLAADVSGAQQAAFFAVF